MLRIFILCCFALLQMTMAHAQGGIFEELSLGEAIFKSKAPAAPMIGRRVRLDTVCDERDGTGIAQQITDGLTAIGVIVDPKALLTLRYEIAPCETNIGRTQSLAQRDAYAGSSRYSELPTPPNQIQIPLGRGKAAGARLSINMLLFKPGQPPLWNAVIAGRAPGRKTQDYLAQMALFAFNHWGEAGELKFELER